MRSEEKREENIYFAWIVQLVRSPRNKVMEREDLKG
jgi:hypothetical protein